MNWIKLPSPWQSWGGSTLLASLSIHGLLLSLPLAAKKDPPKPETLAAVPIAALAAVPAVETSTERPEPEPTVVQPPPQPPPQPPEPVFEEFEPLFDRFPSRQFSSFRDRTNPSPKQPVERAEDTEKTLEAPSEHSETQVHPVVDIKTSTTEFTQPETPPQKTRIDTDNFEPPLKPKPRLQPSQPPLPEEEPPEVVKGQLQEVLGDIRGEGDFSNVEGDLIFVMLDDFENLARLKQVFTTDNDSKLKPEIDPHQFRVIEHQQPEEVYAKLQNELSVQKFSITPVPTPISGIYENSDLYEVKKGSVVSYVNLVELGDQGTLFVVWNQLPGEG
ncbi:MAG: hypothetical protein WBB29_05190 [Geitlerinemataceae cyanobacterium]